MRLAEIRKALLAVVVPIVGAIGTGLSDGNLTRGEVLAAIGLGLVTGAAVYRVPNAQPEPEPPY